jgi:37-kD nucleoid-associated bacterial protein
MLQFWKTTIEKLIIHQVGNKSMEEGVVLNENTIDLIEEEGLSDVLLKFFLKPFKEVPAYSFTHPADLRMNDVYKIISEIFDSSKKFIKNSQNLSKILYELSTHPKIKSGELYIVLFANCQYNEIMTDAIGIFKSETKETFLKVAHEKNSVKIALQNGINTNKLDKGCIILNIEKENGYIVFSVDSTSKSNEALYWKDDFLKLKPLNDDYHYTTNILQLTKQYVTSFLPKAFEVTKTDQVNYLNKSVDYFKSKDDFSIKDFEKEIFNDPSIIKSFRKFGSDYLDKNNIDIADSFEISDSAVKKQARLYKSVLKLDKNFHIYIHGNTDLIEQGYDNRTGKKFYKIYFDQET